MTVRVRDPDLLSLAGTAAALTGSSHYHSAAAEIRLDALDAEMDRPLRDAAALLPPPSVAGSARRRFGMSSGRFSFPVRLMTTQVGIGVVSRAQRRRRQAASIRPRW